MSPARLLTILALVFLAVGLAACSDPGDQFIQGRWQRGNVHYVDEWFFDRGAFSPQSAVVVFQPQLLTGRYTIIESQGDSLNVELYDLSGSFLDETQEIRITLDREAGTLKIGRETYT